MNFVDFYALIKYGEHLSLDHYDGFRHWVDFDDFSRQKFGHQLKDVRLRMVDEQRLDTLYGFHHPVICWNDLKHANTLRGDDSAFPRLPQIAVFKRGQRTSFAPKTPPLTFVPMERLEIFDDKELTFACIRLARLEKLPLPKEEAPRNDCLIEF